MRRDDTFLYRASYGVLRLWVFFVACSIFALDCPAVSDLAWQTQGCIHEAGNTIFLFPCFSFPPIFAYQFTSRQCSHSLLPLAGVFC